MAVRGVRCARSPHASLLHNALFCEVLGQSFRKLHLVSKHRLRRPTGSQNTRYAKWPAPVGRSGCGPGATCVGTRPPRPWPTPAALLLSGAFSQTVRFAHVTQSAAAPVWALRARSPPPTLHCPSPLRVGRDSAGLARPPPRGLPPGRRARPACSGKAQTPLAAPCGRSQRGCTTFKQSAAAQ
jgi:hypothetical protein